MYSTRQKPPEIALAIVTAVLVLTLAAPQAVIAQSNVQMVERWQAVFGSCAEQHRLECDAQPLVASLAIVEPYGPVAYTTHTLQPEETVRVELQVPAALLRTLWMEESSHIIELHVPAALLATMATEDRVQTPPRSPNLCTPFCSSY